MSKSYHQVPDEIAGDFPQHMPDTHIHVLGHDIVRADLQALENQLEADASTERVAWMEQILAEKLAPREVSARERVLGKLGLRNDIMTANESGLVTSIGLRMWEMRSACSHI